MSKVPFNPLWDTYLAAEEARFCWQGVHKLRNAITALFSEISEVPADSDFPVHLTNEEGVVVGRWKNKADILRAREIVCRVIAPSFAGETPAHFFLEALTREELLQRWNEGMEKVATAIDGALSSGYFSPDEVETVRSRFMSLCVDLNDEQKKGQKSSGAQDLIARLVDSLEQSLPEEELGEYRESLSS